MAKKNDELRLKFGTSVDLTGANEQIEEFKKEMSSKKFKIDIDKNALNSLATALVNLKKTLGEVNSKGLVDKGSDVDAYYKNIISYMVQYKSGLMSATQYAEKLHKLMYNSDDKLSKHFTNLDIGKQKEIAKELENALKEQNRELDKQIEKQKELNNSQKQSVEDKKVQAYEKLNNLAKEQYELQDKIANARLHGNSELEKEYQAQLRINKEKQEYYSKDIKASNLVDYEKEAQLLNNINVLEEKAKMTAISRHEQEEKIEASLQQQMLTLRNKLSTSQSKYGDVDGMKSQYTALAKEINKLVDGNGKFTSSLSDTGRALDVAKSKLSQLETEAKETTLALKNNASETQKMKNASAYYENIMKYVNQYRKGIIDVTSYIEKMQKVMFNKDGSLTGNFENMDMSKQLEVIGYLNKGFADQEKILNEIEKTQNAVDNARAKESHSKQVNLYGQLNTLVNQQYLLQEKIRRAKEEGNEELAEEYQRQLQINRAKQENINNNIKNNNLVNYEMEAQLLTRIGALEGNIREQTIIRDRQEDELTETLLRQYQILQQQAEILENRYSGITVTQEHLSSWHSQFDGLVDENNNLTTSTTQMQNALRNARGELSLIRVEARNNQGIFSNLVDNFRRFSVYIVTDGLFRVLSDGVRDALSYLNEMDTYMTNVRIITGQTADEVADLTSKYQQLGQELGMLSTDIAQVAEDFYRQGKTEEETFAMIEATSMMATLAGMDMAEATEYMTSIMNGFKFETKDAMDIVSKLVAIDNSAATSVEELAEALSKSSAVAQSVGVDFDTLVGYIGTVSDVTRQNASSIGEHSPKRIEICVVNCV